jgi:hypothetical protein
MWRSEAQEESGRGMASPYSRDPQNPWNEQESGLFAVRQTVTDHKCREENDLPDAVQMVSMLARSPHGSGFVEPARVTGPGMSWFRRGADRMPVI